MIRRSRRRTFHVSLLTIIVAAPLGNAAALAGDFVDHLPGVSASAVAQTAAAGVERRAAGKLTLGLDGLSDAFQSHQDAIRRGSILPAPFVSDSPLLPVTDTAVVLDAVAIADGEALAAAMRDTGIEVLAVSGKVVSARVALDRLDALEALPELAFARPALAQTSVGSVTSQGDEAQGSDLARANYSVDGSGYQVGVLSDSFDCAGTGSYADDVSTGDLPEGVDVLSDLTADCIDEGRAMAQLVYDVAPGVTLSFHTAFNGEADFAQGIIDLRAAGADIIVDDVGYFAAPFFQDGVVAQAVDQVVADGAAYFSSAGNSARQSYEAAFNPGTIYAQDAFTGNATFWGGQAHDFDPGAGVDEFQQIDCGTGLQIIQSLQWDTPFPSLGGPTPGVDLDFYVFDDPPTTVLGASDAYQLGGADPVEIIGGTCTGTLNLMIVAFSQPANPTLIKIVDFGDGATVEYATDSPTSVGHPNAAGAIATGASAYFNTPAFGQTPPLLNSFSSAGGVPILFEPDGTAIAGGDLRDKPDVTGPDGGNTTFFYPGSDSEQDDFPNFFGTSASAPHIAGLAALMQDAAVGTLSNEEIRVILKSGAIDIQNRSTGDFVGVGFDADSGAGLVDGEAAVAAALALAPRSDLAVTKTDSADPVLAGARLTYSITVSNNGPDAATNVLVADSLPAGVTLASTSGCAEDPIGVPGCTIASLAAGDSADVVIVVDVAPTTSGDITNSVTVSSDNPDPVPGNDTAEEVTTVQLFGDLDGDGCIGRDDVLILIGDVRAGTTDLATQDIDDDGAVTRLDGRALVQAYTNNRGVCP
jgi:uncharacterized repeat protein (TIGR01451 family)